MKFPVFIAGAASAAALFAQTAFADVSFYPIGSRLATRFFDDDVEQVIGYERVFSADMGDLGGAVFSDEPGFRNLQDTFASSGILKISIRAALQRWTGSGFAPTTDRLNFQQFGGATSVYTPVSDPANPDTDPLEHFDWSIGPAELHQHPDYYLVDSTLAGNGSPGIYLAQFHAETDVDGLSRSLPFWFLMNYGQDVADVDAATAFTEEFIVPAPASISVLATTLVLARRSRRA